MCVISRRPHLHLLLFLLLCKMFKTQVELKLNCVEGQDASSVSCDPQASGDDFRRVDGLCNNVENKQWGAGGGIPMRRLAPPDYADNISSPRGRGELPSPREVSDSVHAATKGAGPLSSKGFTHLAMQWGQFLDHDITSTPGAGGKELRPPPIISELDCCDKAFLAKDQELPGFQQRCFNIFGGTRLPCLAFTR